MADIFEIAGRIHSTSQEKVTTTADEILDGSLGMKQNELNAEIASIGAAVQGLNPEQTGALSVAEKANSNEAKIGYYLCDTAASTAGKTVSSTTYTLGLGGSVKIKFEHANTAASGVTLKIGSAEAKPLYYEGAVVSANNTWEDNETVEVYYNGTSYYANNVAGGSGSGDGAFDVSAKYPTSGVESGNTYTLEGALAVLNTNLPARKKKGGMSIKFVQSSDNKYVQYQYTSTSTNSDSFTNISNWESLSDIKDILINEEDITSSTKSKFYDSSNLHIGDTYTGVLYQSSVFEAQKISVKQGEKYYIETYGATVSAKSYVLTNSSNEIVKFGVSSGNAKEIISIESDGTLYLSSRDDIYGGTFKILKIINVIDNINHNITLLDTELTTVKSDIISVQKEAVYDVSAHNGGVVFESLQSLLSSSNLSTLIPTSVRCGGMSLRFIQGSMPNPDNKYVQYRLTATSFSIIPSDWQGTNNGSGAFDISVFNAVEGNPVTFASLTAAIAGNNVPTEAREGGMSVKFILQLYTVAKVTSSEQPTGTPLTTDPAIDAGTKYKATDLSAFVTLPTTDPVVYYISNGEATPTYTIYTISKNVVSSCEYVQYQYTSTSISNESFTNISNWESLSYIENLLFKEADITSSTPSLFYFSDPSMPVGTTYTGILNVSTVFEAQKVSVKQGEKYHIKTYGNTGGAKSYILTNSSNIIVALGASSGNTDITIDIEYDGTLYCSSRNDQWGGEFKIWKIVDTIKTIEANITTLNGRIDSTNLSIDNLAQYEKTKRHSSLLDHLYNPSVVTKIKLFGDSVTHGMGSSDYSESGELIGNTGAKRNTGVKSYAAIFANQILDNYSEIPINIYSSKFITKVPGSTTYDGRYYTTNHAKTLVQFDFYGTYFYLDYVRLSNNGGKFKIIIDDVENTIIDTSLALDDGKIKIDNLSDSHHVVKFVGTAESSVTTSTSYIAFGFVIVPKRIEIVDNGVSGYQSKAIVSLITSLTDSTDNFVTIMAGLNDRAHGAAGETLSSFIGVAEWAKNYRNFELIYITPNPAAQFNENQFENVTQVSRAVKAAADYEDIQCIDCYNYLTRYCVENNKTLLNITPDKLHPNDFGHKLISGYILSELGLAPNFIND